ncbi:UbiA family prenyltransferase [Rhizobium sp. NPDC090279]|uniref:UbiA family prenyltransferase n=1 Tax=Rhizobium sp. NPDC090279 TaxID=3364499 RepID=UPI00383B9A38
MKQQNIDFTDTDRPLTGRISDYIAIARLDHVTKQIFIVPGAVFAYVLRGVHNDNVLAMVVLGLTAAIYIASANYVINEWLDRDFDKHHPTKSQRTAVRRELDPRLVVVEWATLVALGLWCAYSASLSMLVAAVLFAVQGIVYNVRPLRTKETAYLDVISESVNNPLRLCIGWAMIDAGTLPPASVLLCYWLGGAFLMACKRLSEYREITASHGHQTLARYRASFAHYTEVSLTLSCFLYAILSSFFLAVFLLKYRIEYLLLMPLIATLFVYYLAISMQPGSSAQAPEKLFRERGLMLLIVMIAIVFLASTFINIPMLEQFTAQQYISLG